jgi:hypothetical protein
MLKMPVVSEAEKQDASWQHSLAIRIQLNVSV